MESLAKGDLVAQPPPRWKQEKEHALMISSELEGLTVCEHCTSLPYQAAVSSWGQFGKDLAHLPTHAHIAITQALFHGKPGLHQTIFLLR